MSPCLQSSTRDISQCVKLISVPKSICRAPANHEISPSGFPPQRPWFDPRSDHVWLEVAKWHWTSFLFWILLFPRKFSSHEALHHDTAQVFRSDSLGKAAQEMGRSFVRFQCEQISQVQLQSGLPCTVLTLGVYSLFSIDYINTLFYSLFLFVAFLLCLFIIVHISVSFNMPATRSKLSGEVLHSQTREIGSNVYKYMKGTQEWKQQRQQVYQKVVSEE